MEFSINRAAAPDDAYMPIWAPLLALSEVEAIARRCRSMWLDTYAFQARGFYERLGFSVFGQIDGPPPMFPRYFMQKLLA